MPDSIQSLLDTFPEGVIQVKDSVVSTANAAARRCLPQLAVGEPPPDFLPLPGGHAGTGEFFAGASAYTYSCAAAGGEQVILFRPASRPALTARQINGAVYQLRNLLGDILAEVGPASEPGGPPVDAGEFGKTFHRLFRLLGNLECLQQTEDAAFHPVTMDLAGLCRHTEALAGPLLKEAGITLTFRSQESGLLVPGDPELLQKLLLGLIANAAQASEGGDVILTLRRQEGRAVLSMSHSGPPADEKRLESLLQPGVGEDIPLPGQGAGLGLAIARHIAALHRGSLLMEWGQSAPAVLVSLPTGPLDSRTSVHSPTLRRDGGLDPVLTELADLLPARLFGLEALG